MTSPPNLKLWLPAQPDLRVAQRAVDLRSVTVVVDAVDTARRRSCCRCPRCAASALLPYARPDGVVRADAQFEEASMTTAPRCIRLSRRAVGKVEYHTVSACMSAGVARPPAMRIAPR